MVQNLKAQTNQGDFEEKQEGKTHPRGYFLLRKTQKNCRPKVLELQTYTFLSHRQNENF